MRIFLTFAAEQQDIAESILLALRNRGHKVFFSHDDLPPGDSFDLRIQKAIAGSELLIFLISPESVTKGRYTLTELAFARDRWRSPRGHLLPVVVAPVPMASVPNYLKAVTLLEPEGNIAAETAAAVDRLREQSRSRSTLVFGLFGIVTGILSYFAYRYSLPYTKFSFLLSPSSAPEPTTTIVPGIIFGVLVSACVREYGVRERFLLLVVFIFTAVAWILASDCSQLAYNTLWIYKKNISTSEGFFEIPKTSAEVATQESTETPPPPSKVEGIPYLVGISGIVGGFVGGFVTVLGISVATPRYRRLEPWIATVAVATICGALLETIRFGETVGLVALFTIWQAAVIAFISRGLTFGEEVRDQ